MGAGGGLTGALGSLGTGLKGMLPALGGAGTGIPGITQGLGGLYGGLDKALAGFLPNLVNWWNNHPSSRISECIHAKDKYVW